MLLNSAKAYLANLFRNHVSHQQNSKINCNSAMGPKKTHECAHLQAFVSCDLTDVPSPHSPCIRCREPDTKKDTWFCLSCKEVLCNKHCMEHYDQTKHCIYANCRTKAIGCCACKEYLDAQVIDNLMVKSRSTSSKLESIDAIIVDVVDLLSKPFRSINVHPMLDAQTFADQDELELAKEGLRRIFDLGLKALADPKLQEEFLLYSATVLAAESCPLELKVNLSSFTSKLSEETSAFVKAQDELKVASQLSASITQKKVALWQQTSKYAEVKKEIVASDEKVANYKAIIKELEAEIKRVEACLATEESNRKKIDEVIDSIETQVTTARDELVSDMALVSSMEGTTKEANQLVSRKTSDWDKLKTSFTEFATAPSAPVAQDGWDHAPAPAWDWDQLLLEGEVVNGWEGWD